MPQYDAGRPIRSLHDSSPNMRLASPSMLKIANMKTRGNRLVQGHPSSVLYKLMLGSRTGTRDTIDSSYVVTSLFWMDFAPGGTNFPHHHQNAEEIYLALDGHGQMVAGGGMNGSRACIQPRPETLISSGRIAQWVFTMPAARKPISSPFDPYCPTR